MNVFSKNSNIKIMEYINNKSLVKRMPQFILGCLIVSLSYNIFIAPNKIVPGGVGGIAIILNDIFNIDYSLVITVLNGILLILSLLLLGREKTRATILGSILFPLFIRLTEHINVWLQIDTSNLLLSTICGGLMFGFGAGLIFKAGFTTGGTDITNQIISKYLKLSIGKSMLICDGAIVIASAIFFGINHMMYSILMLYIISLISDKVILGISDSKAFFIVTDKDEEVRKYILKVLGHGVTIFNAKGGRHRENETVLMVVIPTKDYYKLKEGINEIDKEAFYIITDTYEVFGGE